MAALSGFEKEVYKKIREAPNSHLASTALNQAFTGRSLEDVSAVINKLMSKGMIQLKTDSNSKKLTYHALSAEETKQAADVKDDPNSAAVLSLVRNAGNIGIWQNEIKKQTNLAQVLLQRCIKSLVNRGIIKQVDDVKHPTRKIFMMSDITPSVELTGGPWYEGNEMDTAFIDGVLGACEAYVQKQSFPRGRKNNPIYPPSRTSRLPTPKMVAEYITSSNITQVTLSVEHVMQLMNVLVYDGKVEILRLSSKALNANRGEPGWGSDIEVGGGGMDSDEEDRTRKERDRERKRKAGKRAQPDSDASGSGSEVDARSASRKRRKLDGNDDGSGSDDARAAKKKRKAKEKAKAKKEKEREKAKKAKRKEKEKKEKEQEKRKRDRSKSRSKSRSRMGSDDTDEDSDPSDSDSDALKTIDEVTSSKKKSKSKSSKSSKSRSKNGKISKGSDSDSDSESSVSSSSSSSSDPSDSSDTDSDVSSSDIDNDKYKLKSGKKAAAGMDAYVNRAYMGSDDLMTNPNVVYRYVRAPQLKIGTIEAPCSGCPQFNFCSEKGPVNPKGCEYFEEWLTHDNGKDDDEDEPKAGIELAI